MKKCCIAVLFLLLVLPCASGEEVLIHVELKQKRLTLYAGNEVRMVCPIADGAPDTPSPMGVFTVYKKFTTALCGFGTRYIGISVPWGQYGIHGTNNPSSLGQSASHGCIRLSVHDAERLYTQVPYGATVWLDGGPFGMLGDQLPLLQPGARSGHVYQVQRRLIRQGFLSGQADGIYGANTSRAILAARVHFGLSPADQVDSALYRALGIMLFE